nr:ABC transporter permease subunit [Bacillus alkalicellulosilyticus]
MLFTSFRQVGSGFTLGNYIEIFQNVFLIQAFQNSILISFFSSLIGLVMALFSSYAITKLLPSVQEKLLIIANLTSNFAGVPLAFAFIVLLGNSGLFTLFFQELGWGILDSFSLYSWSGLVLIYIYFQLPLAVMLLYPVYQGIQQQWQEAASLLGASTFQFWIKIGVPVILPSIVGTFSILFANSMGAYASAYALTGSNYNLVTIRIGALIKGDVFANPELASAISLLLAATMVIALLINEYVMRKIRRDLS